MFTNYKTIRKRIDRLKDLNLWKKTELSKDYQRKK